MDPSVSWVRADFEGTNELMTILSSETFSGESDENFAKRIISLDENSHDKVSPDKIITICLHYLIPSQALLYFNEKHFYFC